MAEDSKDLAEASVLKEFVSILDTLESQKATYSENEFGKNYAGLSSAFEDALGVKPFLAQEGDDVNLSKHVIVEKRHSEDFKKNTIISCLKGGYESNAGFIVREAECVASLGKEEEKVKEEEAVAAE